MAFHCFLVPMNVFLDSRITHIRVLISEAMTGLNHCEPRLSSVQAVRCVSLESLPNPSLCPLSSPWSPRCLLPYVVCNRLHSSQKLNTTGPLALSLPSYYLPGNPFMNPNVINCLLIPVLCSVGNIFHFIM